MQRDLFDVIPTPPAQAHSPTSVAAAQAVAGRTPTLRQQLYEYLLLRGPLGATDEEMQRELAMPASTQRPRRIELVQAGKVRDSGQTRPTASGRQATVWWTLQ